MNPNFNPADYWQGVRQRFDEVVKPRLTAEAVYGDIEGIEKKSHGEWISKCPLPGHEDSSPSFRVNPQTLKFHCFGCGCGGDAVRFAQLSKQVSVKEAFSELARKAGVHPDTVLSNRASSTDKIVRPSEPAAEVANIRKQGLAQEAKVEAERWAAIHAELQGLPHRIRMLEHATDRFTAMHSIRLRELDRVQGVGRMVANIIAEQNEKEITNGKAVRAINVKLPGGLQADCTYTSHYENKTIKRIDEHITVSKIDSSSTQKEVISEQKWQFSPDFGWKDRRTLPSQQREQAKTRTIEVPENPVDALRLYAAKCAETKESLIEMDKAITKHLATEIAKIEGMMLKLPAVELRKVEEAIRAHTEQTPKVQNAIIKFPGGHEVQIKHEASLDKNGRVVGISENISGTNLQDSTKSIEIQNQASGHKDCMYALASDVATAFQENLKSTSDIANSARNYLEQRGVNSESMSQWRIGVADNSVIASGIKDHGWSMEDLHKIGVMAKTTSGEYRCPMAGRIIFPIEDEHRRVCGFAGRIIGDGKEAKEPKYINSPETEIFSKKDLLYGLNHAKDEMVREKEAIVVEGYFDAIAMHQHGIKNAVATMGTALNEKHATKLAGLAPDLAIAYDPDAAGFKAAGRATEIAGREMRVRRVELPEGMDPDEAVRSGTNTISRTLSTTSRSSPDQSLEIDR
jgi:DNA primase